MSSSIQLELPPQRRGGRVRGAEGYDKEDVSALLRCVRAVVPTTTDEWDQVLDEYRNTHAIPNTRAKRDTTSLKTKFKQLLRNYKPETDGHPDAHEAGHISDLIEVKSADGKFQQRRGGRARGAEGFSSADSEALLSLVRRILPVQRLDWNQVAEEYCKEYAELNGRANRDGSSLKNKFRHWLKEDTANVARVEVTEALAIQEEIVAKSKKVATNMPLEKYDFEASKLKTMKLKDESKSNVNGPTAWSLTSSDGGDGVSSSGTRRGGRAMGSEGYSQTDTWALLACVRELLPTDPSTWEQVLQLYRTKHADLKNRAQRNSTGLKIKFRQLINYRGHASKPVPETVLEARAIQKEIDLRTRNWKRCHSESRSDASPTHKLDECMLEGSKSNRADDANTDVQSNLKRPNVNVDSAAWEGSSHQSLFESVKRRKHAISARQEDTESDSLRLEIANRELELLRQREQREAEQAVWEKERSVREKERMDLESWTFVCDRLRTLYRERATETNLDIADEIKEEIALLKKKKQQLASLMA